MERGPTVRFTLADPGHRLAAARVAPDLDLPAGTDLAMRRRAGWWSLAMARPQGVDRIEYLFEIEHRRGRHETITDPANPRRAPGAFGDKSVLTLPGYAEPHWVGRAAAPSTTAKLDVPAPGLGRRIRSLLWAPADLAPDRPAPLVVVHDGPEYERFACVTRYLASGLLPPVRALLVDPGDRNRWYSANDAYADAVTGTLLPAAHERVATTATIGVGASLGGLAMLHLHRRHPGTLAAMLLQSGSFFTPTHDGHEHRFPGYDAVTGFVASVHVAADDPAPIPTVLTCGLTEENLANNREMAATLARLGYPVTLVEVPDRHNFTAWRDALHPALADLVRDAAA